MTRRRMGIRLRWAKSRGRHDNGGKRGTLSKRKKVPFRGVNKKRSLRGMTTWGEECHVERKRKRHQRSHKRGAQGLRNESLSGDRSTRDWRRSTDKGHGEKLGGLKRVVERKRIHLLQTSREGGRSDPHTKKKKRKKKGGASLKINFQAKSPIKEISVQAIRDDFRKKDHAGTVHTFQGT